MPNPNDMTETWAGAVLKEYSFESAMVADKVAFEFNNLSNRAISFCNIVILAEI